MTFSRILLAGLLLHGLPNAPFSWARAVIRPADPSIISAGGSKLFSLTEAAPSMNAVKRDWEPEEDGSAPFTGYIHAVDSITGEDLGALTSEASSSSGGLIPATYTDPRVRRIRFDAILDKESYLWSMQKAGSAEGFVTEAGLQGKNFHNALAYSWTELTDFESCETAAGSAGPADGSGSYLGRPCQVFIFELDMPERWPVFSLRAKWTNHDGSRSDAAWGLANSGYPGALQLFADPAATAAEYSAHIRLVNLTFPHNS